MAVAPSIDLELFQILSEDGALIGERPSSLNDEALEAMYKHMRFLRLVDERMLTLQRQGRISFYGACTGQEAAVIGSGLALEPQDWVYPALREGGVALIRGFDFEDYVAQLFGNAADKTLGRQMPCHYTDRGTHFVSLSSPIATQLPQAIGTAWAMKLRGDEAVVIGYMGDGATSEGDFHVAMNLAGLHNLPIVLFCQNNQWAISSFSGFAGAERTTFAARALGYGLAGLRVDGNDALACYAAEQWAANRARANAGPTLIEFFTYRAEGHSTSDDPSGYRSAQEREEWPLGDPVMRLKNHLIAIGEWDEERQEKMDLEAAEHVKKVTKEAETNGILGHGLHHPFRTMFEDVFEELPWHLQEQANQAVRERETKFPEGLPAKGVQG